MSSHILRIYYATMENVSYTLFVLLLSLDNVIDIFFRKIIYFGYCYYLAGNLVCAATINDT